MVNVLFVCLGNICRSPMAEGVFRKMVDDAGLTDQIQIDSAGTSTYHLGEKADRRTLKTLQQHGINYNGRARQLRDSDFDHYDYILAMDKSNLRNIEVRKPGNAHVITKLFMEYAPQLKEQEVPDPYYDGRFEDVYELVKAASAGLLKTIREEHNL